MKLRLQIKVLIPLFTYIFFSACNPTEQEPNKLSQQEIESGWKLLFDGESLDEWHIYNKANSSSAWVVQNGVIYCDPESDAQKGDLTSNDSYEDYELVFDWKLEKEGNSGVFVNVVESKDIDATYHSGPEYQLLDDAHVDFD